MARISQQTKDGLIVAVTIGVGLATGLFVDKHGKREGTFWSLVALIALATLQIVLSLVPSQDMADLEEYRRGEMASLKVKNAMSAQALKLAEEGKLEAALEWHNASKELQARRQEK